MVSTRRRIERLEDLEARESKASRQSEIPIAIRVYCTHVERNHARERGRPVPRYSEEEIVHMRESDLEIAAGGGVVAAYRENAGWQDPESQEVLDGWEEHARERLARVAELGEEWARAYQDEAEDD